MATLSKAINKNLFDSILPSFGNPRVHIPVWDDSQKMFICDEFESNGGHRYYRVPTSGEIQSVASDKISHSRVC